MGAAEVFIGVICALGVSSGLLLWLGPRRFIVASKPARDLFQGSPPPFRHLSSFGRLLYCIFVGSGFLLICITFLVWTKAAKM
jgi:hypothetical protein